MRFLSRSFFEMTINEQDVQDVRRILPSPRLRMSKKAMDVEECDATKDAQRIKDWPIKKKNKTDPFLYDLPNYLHVYEPYYSRRTVK